MLHKDTMASFLFSISEVWVSNKGNCNHGYNDKQMQRTDSVKWKWQELWDVMNMHLQSLWSSGGDLGLTRNALCALERQISKSSKKGLWMQVVDLTGHLICSPHKPHINDSKQIFFFLTRHKPTRMEGIEKIKHQQTFRNWKEINIQVLTNLTGKTKQTIKPNLKSTMTGKRQPSNNSICTHNFQVA